MVSTVLGVWISHAPMIDRCRVVKQVFFELLMEVFMDYDSEESPYRTCISDLKHTITHASFIPIPDVFVGTLWAYGADQ